MDRFTFSVFILWTGMAAAAEHGFTVANETALRNQLLTTYSLYVRPSSITLIELAFNLLTINYVDMKQEQFSVSGWWSMKWTDSRLSWQNTTWKTIPVIQAYNSEIWTPALVVDNSISNLAAIHEDTIPLRVRNDGQVTWNPPGILETSCEITVTYFPFDTQLCTIEVTSFGFTIQELNISVLETGVSQTYYKKNGEWKLTKVWNERSEVTEDGYTYAKVTFYFQLEHRPLYYGLNTLFPVLLNSLLIPLMFMLPHDSGEKIGYCLTVLLAYVVILTLVADRMPTTATTTSLLGIYIALVLAMSGISVVLAIHSLSVFHRPINMPIPSWQARAARAILAYTHPTQSSSQRVQPVTVKEKHSKQFQPSDENKNPFQVNHSNGIKRENSFLSEVSKDEEITWCLVAKAYDALLLRILTPAIFIISLGFLLGLTTST